MFQNGTVDDQAEYRLRVVERSIRARDGREVLKLLPWYIVKYPNMDEACEPVDYTRDQTFNNSDKQVNGFHYVQAGSRFNEFTGGDVGDPEA